MINDLENTMSDKGYRQFYRQFTQKVLDKIVSPQVLGNTTELENNLIILQIKKSSVMFFKMLL